MPGEHPEPTPEPDPADEAAQESEAARLDAYNQAAEIGRAVEEAIAAQAEPEPLPKQAPGFAKRLQALEDVAGLQARLTASLTESIDEMRSVLAKMPPPGEMLARELTIDDRTRRLLSLLEPFPAEQIGKLPRPMRKNSAKGKCLSKREGGDAPDWQDHFCGGYHGLPAVHLDYVGHADVTIRLLETDPEWSWEPMALDEYGLPLFERNANGDAVRFWIRLTVLGVSRLGVGSVEPGKFEAEKQLIGDALRNAAMRFGVAVHLWSKADHHDDASDSGPERPAEDEDQRPWFERYGWDSEDDAKVAHEELKASLASLDSDDPRRVAGRVWKEEHGWPMTKEAMDGLLTEIARIANEGMDAEAVAAAERDPDPRPDEVPDAYGRPLPLEYTEAAEGGGRVCIFCKGNPCECQPDQEDAADPPPEGEPSEEAPVPAPV